MKVSGVGGGLAPAEKRAWLVIASWFMANFPRADGSFSMPASRFRRSTPTIQ